jgi:predicted RNase H-like HicB family nuclease
LKQLTGKELCRIVEGHGWKLLRIASGHEEMIYRFLIVVEDAGKNSSAYSPDLPGCVASGATREETQQNMREAIQLHIEGLKEEGLPIPTSTAIAEYVVVGD